MDRNPNLRPSLGRDALWGVESLRMPTVDLVHASQPRRPREGPTALHQTLPTSMRETEGNPMPVHHFTLIVEGSDLQSDANINALFAAGCDDATVGRIDGIQYVDFNREAPSLAEAVISAVRAIEQVKDAQVTRIADAGLVSMVDIAKRTGRTRESVRLLVTGARGPGGFPAPVTDPRSRYRLWRWPDVTQWFSETLGETAMVDDHLLSAINASLELRRHLGELTATGRRDLRALAGLS